MQRLGLSVVFTLVLAFVAVSASAVPGTSTSCAWKPTTVPTVAGISLQAVFARAADDVWIVGSQGKEDHTQTLTLHYDGQALSVVPSPNLSGGRNDLHSVVAFAANDAWAVGEAVTRTEPVSHYVPLVLHYDGERWSAVSVPDVKKPYGAIFYAVAGAAPDDVWAVGLQDSGDWVGFTEHWDGSTWKVVASPRASYNALATISPKNAWAAGTSVRPTPNLPTARWNGRSWRIFKDTARAGWETYANAISASSRANVWIVGQEASGPFVERFNGRRFTRVPIPFAHWKANYRRQVNSYFEGVAAISPTNVWAVGTFGIEHFDGRSWTLVSRRRVFSAINALAPTNMWALGSGTVSHYTCP